jgi:hypothetical protein
VSVHRNIVTGMQVIYFYINKTKRNEHKLFHLKKCSSTGRKAPICHHSFSSRLMRLLTELYNPLKRAGLTYKWQRWLKVTHFGPMSFSLEMRHLLSLSYSTTPLKRREDVEVKIHVFLTLTLSMVGRLASRSGRFASGGCLGPRDSQMQWQRENNERK